MPVEVKRVSMDEDEEDFSDFADDEGEEEMMRDHPDRKTFFHQSLQDHSVSSICLFPSSITDTVSSIHPTLIH